MELLFSTQSIVLKKLRTFAKDSPYLTIIILLIVSIILLCTLLTIYVKLRRKFSVSVNCWFCCKDTKVPYDLHNKWNCPNCQQYNGFDKNGDYNKVIKEHYNAKLNDSVFNHFKKCKGPTEKYIPPSNGFCKLCNINQQLKIQQLALFVPLNENKYDEEVEEYRQKLEKAYKLCTKCETIVQTTLKKQEYSFLQSQLNNKPKKPDNIKNFLNNCDIFRKKDNKTDWQGRLFRGATFLFTTYLLLLLLAVLVEWDTENQYFCQQLPHFPFLESLEPLLKIASFVVKNVYEYRREITFSGFLIHLLINLKQENEKIVVSAFFWGLLLISFWTKVTGLQAVICGISLFFNYQKFNLRNMHFTKKAVERKSPLAHCNGRDFQYEMKEINDSFSAALKSSPKEDENTSYLSGERLQKQKPNKKILCNDTPLDSKIKSSKDTEKKKKCKKVGESPVVEEEKLSHPTSQVHSSVFNKSFLASMESNQNERELSPGLDEVYNNMNGLSLGKRPNRNKKPTNFLFENHNFGEKKIFGSSSIIKPAKFVKNLSSSWTNHESNESLSRSSTPSSGYSSQKPDSHFDYPKMMSPIGINPFPRRDYFDYMENNSAGGGVGNRFYNFTCCPYEFMPYQGQYSSPVGHAAVYTYARHSSGPFSFSPPRFPSPYSPTHSPHMSDSSDSENLFQNTSRRFEKDRKWFRIKTVSYYFSLFLNFLTFVSLVYLFSTGILSVDWILPTMNFFV